MKTRITALFLIIAIIAKAQTTDILYVPSQNSLVATYSNKYVPLGFYLGGYYKTYFPQPYIYTTPLTIVNRLGVNVNFNNKVSIMGGGFVESYVDSISFKPDLWIKINPLRILLKTNRGVDFSVGVNYMKDFRYAVGLSIPFGIY